MVLGARQDNGRTGPDQEAKQRWPGRNCFHWCAQNFQNGVLLTTLCYHRGLLAVLAAMRAATADGSSPGNSRVLCQALRFATQAAGSSHGSIKVWLAELILGGTAPDT